MMFRDDAYDSKSSHVFLPTQFEMLIDNERLDES